MPLIAGNVKAGKEDEMQAIEEESEREDGLTTAFENMSPRFDDQQEPYGVSPCFQDCEILLHISMTLGEIDIFRALQGVIKIGGKKISQSWKQGETP
ncbi:unnamed protein product [Caretta caretta]